MNVLNNTRPQLFCAYIAFDLKMQLSYDPVEIVVRLDVIVVASRLERRRLFNSDLNSRNPEGILRVL